MHELRINTVRLDLVWALRSGPLTVWMSLPSSCCRKEGRGYAKAASRLLRSA